MATPPRSESPSADHKGSASSSTAAKQSGPRPAPDASLQSQARGGHVPNHAAQEQEQMQAAVEQMGEDNALQLNEGGRTNDSREKENPKGAVHGVPLPSLKGTWR